MIIETKFNLGQRVWHVDRLELSRLTPCDTCQREGLIVLGGETFTCPKCKGKKTHGVLIRGWIPGFATTVGRVEVKVYANPEQDDPYERYGRPSYMLCATGVGTGTVWKEEDVFGSHEDAKVECDKRNVGAIADMARQLGKELC